MNIIREYRRKQIKNVIRKYKKINIIREYNKKTNKKI